jgi:hypothetical protein
LPSQNPPALPAQLSRPDAQQVVDALNQRLWVPEEAVVNLKDHRIGAKGDGVTDDTAAIKVAIATVKERSGSGTIFCPAGTYVFTEQIDLVKARGILFQGVGALTAGSGPGTKFLYKGPNVDPVWNAEEAFGASFANLQLLYSSDLTGSHLVSYQLSAYCSMKEVFIGGQSGTSTCKGLVNLDETQGGTKFDHVNFQSAQTACRGKTEEKGFTNAVGWYDCIFANLVGAAIRNPGEDWSFFNPTVEGLQNGKAAFISQDEGFTSKMTSIFGGWFGDANQEGDWITYSGYGLTTVGVKVGDAASWVRCGSNAPVEGLLVSGCTFDSTKHLLTVLKGAHKGWNVTANQYVNTGAVEWAAESSVTRGVIDNPKSDILNLGMVMSHVGAVSDAAFATPPPDMTVAYDTENNKLYIRNSGAWKSAAFT